MEFNLKSLITSHSYTIIMAFGAVITTIKLILFASYVVPEDFNAYVIPLSLGAFLAFCLSLGLVESTTKLFSRLHEEKNDLIVIGSYRYILPILLKRAVLLCGLITIYIAFLKNSSIFLGLLIGVIAMIMAASTLLASMQRGTMKTNVLASTSFLRAIMSVFAIFVGYSFSPNYGPIIGEIVSQTLSLLIGFALLLKSHDISHQELFTISMSRISKSIRQRHGLKLTLFIAYLIVSTPLYLDRYYFELIYPIRELAPYSLCAILLSTSYLVFNTLYQRSGPLMIIKYKSGTSPFAVMGMAVKTALAGTLCLTLLFAIVILIYMFGWAESLFARYFVSLEMLLLVFLISIFNCTGIFEGVFLSFDQEKAFMQSSFFYLTCLLMLGGMNFLFSFGLLDFLIGYLVVKTAHLLYMLIMLLSYAKNYVNPQVVT